MTTTKNKVLFFAPILEYPPAGGPQISVTNAIKALSACTELHILTTVSKDSLSQEASDFFQSYCVSLSFAPSSKFHVEGGFAGRVVSRLKRRELAKFLAKSDVVCTQKLDNKLNFDVIWVDRVIELAFHYFLLLRQKFPDTKIVGDTEAVYSRFVLRELPLINNPIRRYRVQRRGKQKLDEERLLVEKADAITAVSELDADYFREISKSPQKVKLFSNIVDIADYFDACEDVTGNKNYALLIGSFGHPNSPMDRAAKWLIEEIMPIVKRKVPDAHLYIVGRNADITLSHYNVEYVTIKGRVRSMRPYLKNTRVSLVPLKYESGTRFKILETGASTVPCVSTTLGAEGLNVTDGEDILIGDTAESFAQAMVKVLSDKCLAKKLAQNLHGLIEENYSLKVQIEDAKRILNYLRT